MMGNGYIDVSLELGESLGDGSGDGWDNAADWTKFEQYYNSLGYGGSVRIGGDIQKPAYLALWQEGVTLGRTGAADMQEFTVAFGAKGNHLETGLDQNAIRLMGDRPVPHSRQDSDGGDCFQITASYNTLQGVNAYNFGEVVNIAAGLTSVKIIDLQADNIGDAIIFGSDCVDVVVTNLAVKNCSSQAIKLDTNITGAVINDFSIAGVGTEDGEARYINIRDDHSEVYISNGTISNAIDGYQGWNPDTPGGYNQGDGISAEHGDTLHIDNVSITGCTDRGIDCKAYCVFSNVEVSDSKIGIASWTGGVITNTTILNPKSNSSNAGVGFQVLSGTCVYNNCSVVLGGETNSHEKWPQAFYLGGSSIVILKGGIYKVGSNATFATGASGATIVLRNTEVDGVRYTGTKTFTANFTEWHPSDGLD